MPAAAAVSCDATVPGGTVPEVPSDVTAEDVSSIDMMDPIVSRKLAFVFGFRAASPATEGVPRRRRGTRGGHDVGALGHKAGLAPAGTLVRSRSGWEPVEFRGAAGG